jgi:hypothetical protein
MSKRTKVDLSKTRLRSAITNGKHVLADVDHRGGEMRRLRDLVAGHISDLGGSDQCSHSERILVSKASMICLLTEMQEQQFARAKFEISPRQLACYLHAVGNLNRVLVTLGLQRRAKPVMSLDQYLKGKEESESNEEEETDTGEVNE